MKFVTTGLTIKGSLVGNMQETNAVLEFARTGQLKQICEVVPLSKMPEAIARLKTHEVPGRLVVDFNA